MATFTLHGRIQRTIKAPSFLKPSGNGCAFQAVAFSHLSYRMFSVLGACRQRFFNIPSQQQQALANAVTRQPHSPSPFRQSFGFTTECQVVVRAFISGLLFWRGPSAILWRVIAIVVDPINRVLLGWLRPHVLQKRLERVAPASAYGDASSAITRIRLTRDLITTFKDTKPRFVLRRPGASMRSGHLTNFITQAV